MLEKGGGVAGAGSKAMWSSSMIARYRLDGATSSAEPDAHARAEFNITVGRHRTTRLLGAARN